MKNLKKMLSFVLAIVLVFGANLTTAFAAEPGDTVTEPVRHTIEVVVEPGEEAGIMPLMWDDDNIGVTRNTTVTTESFTVPERYMAFEATVTDSNGNACNTNCTVSIYSNSFVRAAISVNADGIMTKKDWVDLKSTNTSCYFKIANASNTALRVYLVYYSWS